MSGDGSQKQPGDAKVAQAHELLASMLGADPWDDSHYAQQIREYIAAVAERVENSPWQIDTSVGPVQLYRPGIDGP